MEEAVTQARWVTGPIPAPGQQPGAHPPSWACPSTASLPNQASTSGDFQLLNAQNSLVPLASTDSSIWGANHLGKLTLDIRLHVQCQGACASSPQVPKEMYPEMNKYRFPCLDTE